MADYRTLAQVKEEVEPIGTKVKGSEIIGVPFLLERAEPYKGRHGDAVRLICVDLDSGERFHFSAGGHVWQQIEHLVDHLPFATRLLEVETLSGQKAYVLDDGRQT